MSKTQKVAGPRVQIADADMRAWREFVASMEALIAAGDATIERLRATTAKAA